MRKITVTPYNKEWTTHFQQEVLKLKEIFGTEIFEIFHIGSTAVPDLSAKPIIDIMPIVHDITRIDKYDEDRIQTKRGKWY